MTKRLVLLGGGHAHVHVLNELAASVRASTAHEAVDVTLISPYASQVYSGMLPGWIAGHYELAQCRIPLAPLAARAKARFLKTRAVGIDFERNLVACENGEHVAFDALSIDTGPVADLSHLPGAQEHAIAVRPIEAFIDAYESIAANLARRRSDPAAMRMPARIVFVGAGAGGVELAMAMKHAFRDVNLGVTLVSAENSLPGRAGPRVARHLRDQGIALIAGQAATAVEARGVRLASGGVIEADHVFVATGAAAATWPRCSGLVCDQAGFILVNDRLQSVSHANVFAAGDCATMEHFPRPKSGVYAVRAGPPLMENLRRFLRGEPLAPYHPQKRSLYLLSTGRRHAIAVWGGFSWEGGWVWRWKDGIDRRFVAKYTVPDA